MTHNYSSPLPMAGVAAAPGCKQLYFSSYTSHRRRVRKIRTPNKFNSITLMQHIVEQKNTNKYYLSFIYIVRVKDVPEKLRGHCYYTVPIEVPLAVRKWCLFFFFYKRHSQSLRDKNVNYTKCFPLL